MVEIAMPSFAICEVVGWGRGEKKWLRQEKGLRPSKGVVFINKLFPKIYVTFFVEQSVTLRDAERAEIRVKRSVYPSAPCQRVRKPRYAPISCLPFLSQICSCYDFQRKEGVFAAFPLAIGAFVHDFQRKWCVFSYFPLVIREFFCKFADET